MQKYSKQREEIKNAVLMNRVHPTADEVYAYVRKVNPNISLGTVYRNLNTLSEHGVINKIEIPNGSDRFDGTIEPHYHAICTECGAVSDIEIQVLNGLDQVVKQQSGFEVTTHNLIVYGVCKDCQSHKLN